jgi:hypothetical protein
MRSASARTDPSDARGGAGLGGAVSASRARMLAAGTRSSCTLIGRLSTTVRRSSRARRNACTTSFSALAAEFTRCGLASTESASPDWSIEKFVGTGAGADSAASTSIGVRLLAASPMPVTAFVSPQPWCTETSATVSLMRAYASAIVAAPPSWRVAVNSTPASRSAFVTAKLPEPTTPKQCRAPSFASARPTSSATVNPHTSVLMSVLMPTLRRGRRRGSGCRYRRRSAAARR